MDWEEACHILGVNDTASDAEIHEQYMYKVQLLHPDTNFNKPERVRIKAEEELKLVNQAYTFLKEPSNNPYNTPPKLDISPTHIRFKDVEIGQKKITTFEIRSVGGPYTNIWIDNEPATWLSVTGVRSLTNEQLPLEVTIESTGAGEAGENYTCELLVRLENEKTKCKDEATIKVELWTKEEPASLLADKNKIEIKKIRAGDTEVRTFELSNIGRGWLKGSISTSKPWLSVQPNSIDIAPSEKHLYTITVKTSLLAYGFEDKDSICLYSNAGNYAIPIDISIATPSVDATSSPDSGLRQYQYNYSVKAFIIMFLCMLVIPFIPPLLFFTIGAWLYLQKPLFWVGVGIYGVVAIIFSDMKGREGSKKVVYKSSPAPKQTNTTSSRDIWGKSTLATKFVIANTFTEVYHRPSCKWAKRTSPSNVVKVTTEEARRRGYKPCGACRP